MFFRHVAFPEIMIDPNGILEFRDINRLRERILASAEVSQHTSEFDVTSDAREISE